MTDKSIPQGFHAHKYHALGNDYLVVDPSELDISLSPASISAICDRNHGVGSDGILYGPLASLENSAPRKDARGTGNRSAESELSTSSARGPTETCAMAPSVLGAADFYLRIFNPDGSEAEKSGNGLRIFSLYLYETGRVENGTFHIGTKGGVVESRILPQPIIETGAAAPRLIEVAMGEPHFLPGPPTMTFEGIDFRAVRVSMGNPHCVLLGPTPSEELARGIGPLVERHPSFPHRTNVQFLEVLDRHNIRIEIWERGAGYTLASGTSSCAAASAAHNLGLVDDTVTVHMPGGKLQIDMGGGNITMIGPAVRTFDALFSEHLLRLTREWHRH